MTPGVGVSGYFSVRARRLSCLFGLPEHPSSGAPSRCLSPAAEDPAAKVSSADCTSRFALIRISPVMRRCGTEAKRLRAPPAVPFSCRKALPTSSRWRRASVSRLRLHHPRYHRLGPGPAAGFFVDRRPNPHPGPQNNTRSMSRIHMDRRYRSEPSGSRQVSKDSPKNWRSSISRLEHRAINHFSRLFSPSVGAESSECCCRAPPG
jgi:hypothetical protein